jgi:hypothetical protein
VSQPDDARPSDLDVSSEPEPDRAEAIRRGRRERSQRLRRLLGDPPVREPAATDEPDGREP